MNVGEKHYFWPDKNKFMSIDFRKENGVGKLSFPKGVYHFYPTFAPDHYCAITNNDNGLKRTAFPIIGFDGLEIEGKLATKRVKGGIILDETTYTIKV